MNYMDMEEDRRWMDRALELAGRAEELGEVPVGALVVRDGELLGEGWNRPIASDDPTAHAEILAIRAACKAVGNYRLPGAVLYVTLEPCAMCAGAIVHARLQKVVFATRDPRAGACRSVFELLDHPALNHRCEIVEGIEADASADLLKAFFEARR